jgi:molecular chaperone GrpE
LTSGGELQATMTEEDQQSTNGNTPAPEKRADAGTPEERVTALEAEKLELRDRMLRIAAEFENWKKRSRREQSEAESKGKEVVLRDMLEVADNLERALAAATGADPSIQQGVQLVLRMFQNKLERHDVKPIDAKGTPFDPRMHDAISQVPTSEVPPGTVISELQKGYKIGDRLLRPATVVVGIAPPAAAGPNGEGRGGEGGEGS